MIASALVGGMLVGVIVCVLNQCLHFPFLLAAIVTNGLFHGITQYVLGSSVMSFQLAVFIDEYFLLLAINSCLIALLVFGLRSQFGYSLAIYGNNPLFFMHHHLSSRYVVFAGVLIGHALAGLSGFLFAQFNGFIDLTMNFGIVLLCLTALIIGKFGFRTPRPHLFTPLLGIVAYFIIQHSLLRMGFNLKYFNSFQALFILSLLALGKRKQTLQFDHLGV